MKIKKNQDSSSQIIEENGLTRICAEFLVVQIIYDSYRKTTSFVFDVINKCVRLIEHSLATWILWFTGVINHPLSDHSHWLNFRNLYSSHNEKLLEGEIRLVFQIKITCLQECVLSQMSVIVCTVNDADESKLYTQFKSVIVFVDETEMIAELNTLISFVHYSNTSVVMIDNQKQLKLTVLTVNCESHQFTEQILVSMFSHLLCLEHSLMMFIKQHCIIAEIIRITSSLFYNDLLTNVMFTELNYHDWSVKFRAFMMQYYVIRQSVLLLNVKKKTEQIEMFRANSVNASVVVTVVEKLLLDRFQSAELTIITSYWAQQDLYHCTLHNLQQHYKNIDICSIQNKTIDSFQDNKTSIILLNFVVTEHLSFLWQMNWLNVALTWVRDGLIMIMNVNVNEKWSVQNHSKWIEKIFSHMKQMRLMKAVKLSKHNQYVSSLTVINVTDVHEDDVDHNNAAVIIITFNANNNADFWVSIFTSAASLINNADWESVSAPTASFINNADWKSVSAFTASTNSTDTNIIVSVFTDSTPSQRH